MRELFRCVRLRYLLILPIGTILFAIFDTAICNNIAMLPTSVLHGNIPSTLTAIGISAILCLLIEWVLDTTDELFCTDLTMRRSQYFIDKIYTIKPEVLKVYNTGYISGLSNALIDKQYDVLEHLIISIPETFGFVAYGVFQLSRHSIGAAVAFILLYVILSIFRISYSKFIMHKHNLELRENEADRERYYIDTVANISTVQRMNAIDFASTRMKAYGMRCYIKMRRVTHLDELSFIIFKYACYAFVPAVILTLYLTGSPAISEPAFIAVCVTLGIKCPHHGRSFYRLFRAYEKYKSSAEKMEAILDESNKRVCLSEDGFVYATIRDCSYSYTDISNTERKINIPKFTVNKGDIICVHGESGQGKTTLLNILSKEIETSSVFPSNNSRLNCAFVAQDTEMLDMELYENLTLGKSVPFKRILDMFESVGLMDWYNSLAKGFETILGERGVFVSTGQRQRLNLIRGMLMDKDIYLLDEPTSNVDDETEARIVEFLSRELKGKTAVIVTHRPAIMSICTRSYLFENGTLREES